MAKEESTFAARQSVEDVVRAQSDERLQMGGRESLDLASVRGQRWPRTRNGRVEGFTTSLW